ncbi:MAG: transcriptional regulator, TetR family [Betaproteobacteria bacterium]|nr:transcriptional regulator, TetR family [Betaproteobacteria bacterium]
MPTKTATRRSLARSPAPAAAAVASTPAKAKSAAHDAPVRSLAVRAASKKAGRVTRDPEQTRQRILIAAQAEFARVGLGGARVDRIAQEAGANKRMLYYYFGNKDDLFLAVLEYTYEHIRTAEKGLHLDEVEPAEAVRRLVAFTWNYYLDYPQFLNLLNSENLHQARHLKNSGKVRSMHSPFISMIGQILERGARDGTFRKGVDPIQLYVSIAGLSYFYLGNNYTLSAIFGRDLKAPKAKAERLAHMTEMVLDYLTHLPA